MAQPPSKKLARTPMGTSKQLVPSLSSLLLWYYFHFASKTPDALQQFATVMCAVSGTCFVETNFRVCKQCERCDLPVLTEFVNCFFCYCVISMNFFSICCSAVSSNEESINVLQNMPNIWFNLLPCLPGYIGNPRSPLPWLHPGSMFQCKRRE